jgi:hypothetical protein
MQLDEGCNLTSHVQRHRKFRHGMLDARFLECPGSASLGETFDPTRGKLSTIDPGGKMQYSRASEILIGSLRNQNGQLFLSVSMRVGRILM